MKKSFIISLIYSTTALSVVFIYYSLTKTNTFFYFSLVVVTIIALILCTIFRKDILVSFRETSFERYISLIGLEIAIFAFIQTSIQVEKNNIQFEENRIASDSLFKTQLKHSENLSQTQIENSQNLNDSLIQELNKIQDINIDQSLAAKNQLAATKRQLELSEQSLKDYLFETKSNMAVGLIKIIKTDTLNSKELKFVILNKIQNLGKRDASKIEFRHLLIFKDGNKSELFVNKNAKYLTINTPLDVTYFPTVPQKDATDFYYWL